TVTDEHGNVLPGLDVQIEASGGQAVGPVTDHGDGTYSAEVTATTVAGEFEVTATVAGLDSGTGSATLTQVAGAPADVELVVSEWVAGAGVRAAGGGTASFEAVATVTDTFGNFVPGADVRFATDGPQSVGPVTEDPVGRYAVRIDSPRGVGELIVTVSAGDVAARVVVPVPPAQAPGEEAPNEGEAPEEEAPDEEAPDDDGAADDETRGDDDASDEDELATTGASLETLSLAAIFLVAGVLVLVISGAGLRLAARDARVPRRRAHLEPAPRAARPAGSDRLLARDAARASGAARPHARLHPPPAAREVSRLARPCGCRRAVLDLPRRRRRPARLPIRPHPYRAVGRRRVARGEYGAARLRVGAPAREARAALARRRGRDV